MPKCVLFLLRWRYACCFSWCRCCVRVDVAQGVSSKNMSWQSCVSAQASPICCWSVNFDATSVSSYRLFVLWPRTCVHSVIVRGESFCVRRVHRFVMAGIQPWLNFVSSLSFLLLASFKYRQAIFLLFCNFEVCWLYYEPIEMSMCALATLCACVSLCMCVCTYISCWFSFFFFFKRECCGCQVQHCGEVLLVMAFSSSAGTVWCPLCFMLGRRGGVILLLRTLQAGWESILFPCHYSPAPCRPFARLFWGCCTRQALSYFRTAGFCAWLQRQPLPRLLLRRSPLSFAWPPDVRWFFRHQRHGANGRCHSKRVV